jgi:sugar phosphate isomerase/epimerase
MVMPDLTRRELLALSLAGAAGGRLAAAAGPLGVQLYTVRQQIASDPRPTLEAIAKIGYTELEILQNTLAVVAPIARTLGLTIVSSHLEAPTWKGDGLAAFADRARDAGIRYLVVPYVAPAERPTDRAGFERLSAQIARAGDEAKRAGLQLCYHNHAFEFGRDRDGTRWIDVMMQRTDPALVKLEMDVFWVSVTGADPLALIAQYGGRTALMHLKDKARDAAPRLDEQVPPTDFVEVGSGALDFPAILTAAKKAGVAHYFVEQDQTRGNPVSSLEKSYKYLVTTA